MLALLSADYSAFSFFQEGLDLARATGDPAGIAASLGRLGLRANMTNERERATAMVEESLAAAREAGDPWLTALCLQITGVVARGRGDVERAAALFQDSLALTRQVGDIWSLVFVLLNLGGMAQARDDYEAARAAYQEGAALSWELRDKRGMAWCLEALAEIAAAEHQPQRGARLMGAAEGLLDAAGASWPPNYAAGRERSMAVIRPALGEEAFATALADGRAMRPEQAIAYTLEAPAARGGGTV